MERQEKVIENIFEDQVFDRIVNICKRSYKRFPYSEDFGRYFVNNHEWKAIEPFYARSVELARNIFESDTLLPSYALFAHYEGEKASLEKHIDNNACTYTLDICLYQETAWDLFVEGRAYTLQPNQALAFYGEEQEHWREDFPDPENNKVGMLFLHYVEPDHWFYKDKNV